MGPCRKASVGEADRKPQRDFGGFVLGWPGVRKDDQQEKHNEFVGAPFGPRVVHRSGPVTTCERTGANGQAL